MARELAIAKRELEIQRLPVEEQTARGHVEGNGAYLLHRLCRIE